MEEEKEKKEEYLAIESLPVKISANNGRKRFVGTRNVQRKTITTSSSMFC